MKILAVFLKKLGSWSKKCISQASPRNRNNKTDIYLSIYLPTYLLRQRFTLRKRLMWLCELTSLNSAGQAHRLETQGGVDVVPRAWRQSRSRIPFSLEDLGLLFLMPESYWMKPIHIMENSLLYSKCTDLNVDHI